MFLIDLSNGFSSTCLLAAILSFEKRYIRILKETLEVCPIGKSDYSEIVQEVINVFNNVDLEINSSKINRNAHLLKDQLIFLSGKYSEKVKEIIKSTTETKISIFDFIIYLSLIILLDIEIVQNSIKLTIPLLGINSSTITFNLFAEEKFIIDISGKAVQPLLAAILRFYFKSFTEIISCVLISVTEIHDPFEYSSAIRIFQIKDCINHDKNLEENDIITILETNIDDSTSEIVADAMKMMLKKGALDYTISPVTMKKGRLGFKIQVICNCENADIMMSEMLRSTSTFGVRKYLAERVKLKRKIRSYQTKFGQINIKEGFIGEKLIKVTPEFDDVVRISEEKNISLYTLYNVIMGELNQMIV